MKQYTGMRKGISLVEMIIAIILFATLATIGLKYTKLYLNTDMTAKKARVAAATDQANQLLQAYQIYKTETGQEPSSINDLNGSSMILTEIPTQITEISATGWAFAPDFNGSGLPAFSLVIDNANFSGSDANVTAGKEYCAIFNRQFDSTVSLNIDSNITFGEENNITGSKATYARNAFCYSQDANTTAIVIFVP